MRRKKMNLKNSAIAILLALIFLGTFAHAATKVELDDITVSLSENSTSSVEDSLTINSGDSFYLRVELSGPSDTFDSTRMDVKINVGDVLVYSEKPTIDFIEGKTYVLNISSSEFTQGDTWIDNLMDYDCGKKTIEVTVAGRDLKSTYTDTAKLTIEGDPLRVKLSPANPTVSDKIIVTVTDEDDDEVEDVTVKFTNLGDDDVWDSKDAVWDDKTDSDGEITVKLKDETDFEDNLYGKYQVDAYVKNDQYCKYKTTIDSRHTLTLTKIEPDQMKAGATIKMRVTDDTNNGVSGVKVSVSRTADVFTLTSDANGYVLFQLNDTGSYTALASRTGYTDSTSIKLTIAQKDAIEVDVTPKDAEVGKEVQVKVSANGGALVKDAKMLLTKPDGITEEVAVGSDGIAKIIPALSGKYSLKVDAPLYTSASKDFVAYKVFSVTTTDILTPNTDIVVTVKDSEDKPIKDAEVSVKEAKLVGNTDFNGKYTFKVSDAGSYTITVRRESYMDYTKKMDVKGGLVVKMRSKTANIGDDIEFIVQDTQGNVVTNAEIKVIKSSGEESTVSGVYKADAAGKFSVKATKIGYDAATASFEVKAYTLSIKSKIDGTKITATATSSGKVVSDIVLSFDAEGFHDEVTTDKNGKAAIDIQKSNLTGNVTISSGGGNYESTSVVQEIKEAESGDSSTLLVILVALVILVIAIIAVTTQKEGRRRKEKGMLYRGGGSRLEKGW